MSTITVIYGAKRKLVKISPMQPVQFIVDSCAELFELDSYKCQLKYKNKILDLSQPFRYSGILNNSNIDLILLQPSVSYSGDVKIIINGSSFENSISSFSAGASLLDVLNGFGEKGVFSQDAIANGPEIIYLCKKYDGEHLLRVSLSSLGLAGKTAKFQVHFKSSNSAEMVSAPPNDESSMEVLDASGVEVDISNEDVIEKIKTSIDHEVPIEENTNTNSKPHFFHINMQLLEKATQEILSTNFDQVSVTAILTLLKYIDNLLRIPFDVKYCTINLENIKFQETIFRTGSLKALLCLGYTNAMVPNSTEILHTSTNDLFILLLKEKKLHFPYHVISFEDELQLQLQLQLQGAESPNDHMLVSHTTREELVTARQYFVSILINELRVEECKVPILQPALKVPELPVVEFNPFKSMILTTRPVTSSGQSHVTVKTVLGQNVSLTDTKLEQINKRRRELEGDRSDVMRRTEIYFPLPTSSAVSESKADGRDASIEEESDSRMQAKLMAALVKKISSGKDDEGPPLTTKAFRDVEHAQNEVVYSQTLLQIRFPNRVRVQAYFHPRDTIADVKAWLRSEVLTDEVLQYSCELFTSPPKTIISNLDDSSTLFSLKFVPSAIIFLSWIDIKTDLLHSDNYNAIFQCSLIDSMNRKSSNDDTPNAARVLPVGKKLIDIPSVETHNNMLSNVADGKADKKSESGKSKSGKPSWMKL